jgi:lysozyme
MSARQKKLIIRLVLLSLFVSTLIVVGSMVSQWLRYRKASFTRYPEFGITIPVDYSIHGIDVSRYQNIIAWEQVQAMKVSSISLGFAYIKATEGIANVDPQFNRNWKRSKEAGIIRGAYHFFIGSKDGKMQAENFIAKVDLETGDLPPVLDIEQLNGASAAELKKEAIRFLAVVEENYKVKPVIYTNVDFYDRYLGSDFDKYPLWVAHYYQPQQPRVNRGWVLWQHNDGGRVNGIISPVDFNVFNGDSLSFRDFLLK